MYQFKSHNTAYIATALLLLFSCRLVAYQENFVAELEKLAASSPSTMSPIERAPTDEEIELLKRLATQPTEARIEYLAKLLKSDVKGIPIEYVTNVVTQGDTEIAQQVVDKILLPIVAEKGISEQLEDKCARIIVQLDIPLQSDQLNAIGFDWILKHCGVVEGEIEKIFLRKRAFAFVSALPGNRVEELFLISADEWAKAHHHLEQLSDTAVDPTELEKSVSKVSEIAMFAARCATQFEKKKIDQFRPRIVEILEWSPGRYTRLFMSEMKFTEAEMGEVFVEQRANLERFPTLVARPISNAREPIPFDELILDIEDDSANQRSIDAVIQHNKPSFENLSETNARRLVHGIYQALFRGHFQEHSPNIAVTFFRYGEHLREDEAKRIFDKLLPLVDHSTDQRDLGTNTTLLSAASFALGEDHLTEAIESIIAHRQASPNAFELTQPAEIICERLATEDKLASEVAMKYAQSLKEITFYPACLAILEKQVSSIREPFLTQLIQEKISNPSKNFWGDIAQFDQIAASPASSEQQSLDCLKHCLATLLNHVDQPVKPARANPIRFHRSSFNQVGDDVLSEHLAPVLEVFSKLQANEASKTLLRFVAECSTVLSAAQAEELLDPWLLHIQSDQSHNNFALKCFAQFVNLRPESEQRIYAKKLLEHCIEKEPLERNRGRPTLLTWSLHHFHSQIDPPLAVNLIQQILERCVNVKKYERSIVETLRNLGQILDTDGRQKIFTSALALMDQNPNDTLFGIVTQGLTLNTIKNRDHEKKQILELWITHRRRVGKTDSLCMFLKPGFEDQDICRDLVTEIIGLLDDPTNNSIKVAEWLKVLTAIDSELTKENADKVIKVVTSHRQSDLNRFDSSKLLGTASQNATREFLRSTNPSDKNVLSKIAVVAGLLHPDESEAWLAIFLDQARTKWKDLSKFEIIQTKAIQSLARKTENGNKQLLEFILEFVDYDDERMKSALTSLAGAPLAKLLVDNPQDFKHYHDLLRRRVPRLEQHLTQAIIEELDRTSTHQAWVKKVEACLALKHSENLEVFHAAIFSQVLTRPFDQQIGIFKHFAKAPSNRNLINNGIQVGTTGYPPVPRSRPIRSKKEILADPELVGLPRIFVLHFLD